LVARTPISFDDFGKDIWEQKKLTIAQPLWI